MASRKPLILIFHGLFHLLMPFFAALAGSAASVTLPVALHFCFSAVDAVLGFLPQLRNALLGWSTPSCLFILSNGIIFVLTASSGMLSSSASLSSVSSDFCPKPVDVVQSFPENFSEAVAEDRSSDMPSKCLSAKQNVQVLVVESSVLSTQRDLDADGESQEEELLFFDAEDRSANNDNDVHDSHKFSKFDKQSRSFSFSRENHRRGAKNEVDEGDNTQSQSRHCLVKRSMALLYSREEGDIVGLRPGKSMAPLPQPAEPAKAQSIIRSRSVDSAPPYQEHLSSSAGVPTVETLSDEAFRKRVEDFISKMNAKMRTEVK